MRRTTHEAAAAIRALVEDVFESLQPIVALCGKILAAHPSRAELAAIDPLAKAAVQRPDGLIVGAGYVAAPSVLTDAPYWLQWWSDYDTPRTGVPQRLQADVDPASEAFVDYTGLPWYAVPARTLARHVAGPYVDFLCTDEYTLTFAVPVLTDGRFSGIVGADVYAREMDAAAQPLLAALGRPAALLNLTGRVVSASRSPYATGDIVRDDAVSAALEAQRDGAVGGGELLRCGGVPFTLLVGAPAA